jgi:broad specificity phosphatase PhoE
MAIYLLRHGQSEANRESLFSGVTDHRLTDLGREQARQVGQRFKEREFGHLFTSQLCRTVETADIFVAASGAKIGRREACIELNERNFGVLEGLKESKDQTTEGHVQFWACRDIDCIPQGGESMRQTHARAVAFLDMIKSRNDGDILIIAHGYVLRSMTLHALGWPIEMLPEMPTRNCLVTRLAY